MIRKPMGVAEQMDQPYQNEGYCSLGIQVHAYIVLVCYAVAWVAKCYNQKFLDRNQERIFPSFGQLLLFRTKRNHKLEERDVLA